MKADKCIAFLSFGYAGRPKTVRRCMTTAERGRYKLHFCFVHRRLFNAGRMELDGKTGRWISVARAAQPCGEDRPRGQEETMRMDRIIIHGQISPAAHIPGERERLREGETWRDAAVRAYRRVSANPRRRIWTSVGLCTPLGAGLYRVQFAHPQGGRGTSSVSNGSALSASCIVSVM